MGIIGAFFSDIFGNRYEASSEDLDDSIKLLNEATEKLAKINENIQEKERIVYDALGEYSDRIGFGNLDTYVPQLQEQFNSLIETLKEQEEIIYNYENSNGWQRAFATGGVLATSLFEGVGSVLEDLVDTGAVIISGVGSVLGADTTSIELWAARDLTGELADSFYANTSVGKWLDTYSNASHESTAANVFKGIGTAIPYVVLAASGVGLAGEALAAGATGFGRGASDYMGQHLTYNGNELAFDDDYSLGEAYVNGGVEGVKDAALTIVMDKGFKKIDKIKNAKVQADCIAKTGNERLLSKYKAAGSETTEDAVKALKEDIAKGLKGSEKAGKEMTEDAIEKEAKRLAEKAGKGKLKGNDFEKINNLLPEGKKVAQGEIETALNNKLVANEEKRLMNNPTEAERQQIRNAGNEAVAKAPESSLTDINEIASKHGIDAKQVTDKMKKAGDISDAQKMVARQKGELSEIQKMAKNKNITNATTEELKAVSKETKIGLKETISGKEKVAETASPTSPEVETKWKKKDYKNAAEELGQDNPVVKKYNSSKAKPTSTKEQQATSEIAKNNLKKEYNAQSYIKNNPVSEKALKMDARMDAKAARTAKFNESKLGQATAKVQDGFSNLKTSISNSSAVQAIADSTPAKLAKGLDKGVTNIVEKVPKLATGTATTFLVGSKIDNGTPYISPEITGIDIGEYNENVSPRVIGEIDDLTLPESVNQTPQPKNSYTGPYTTPNTQPTSPTNPVSPVEPVIPAEPITPVEPVTPTEPVTPPEPTTPTEPTNPTQPTTPTEPTIPENPGTTITNPEPTPTPPVRNDNGGSNSGVDHGGNWSNGGNYNNGSENIWSGITGNGEVTEPELPDGELPIEEPTDTELPGTEESVYTIPTDLSGVTTKKNSSGGSSVIPVLGGLGAAAAVGVGAKIYMDNKKNNDNGEDDDYTDDFEFKDENNDNGDDLLADEWKEDDNDDTSLNFNDIVNDASEDNNDLGEI